MRNLNRSLGCVALVTMFLVQGCGPKHIALSEETATHIKSVKVMSVIPQKIVVPTVLPSKGEAAAAGAGVMFGAIGGAISGAIAGSIAVSNYHAAEKKLVPLTDLIQEIDFRKEFVEGLRQATQGSDRLVVQEIVSADQAYGKSERKDMLKKMAEDALLVVTTDYYLSPDFRVLNVRSQAEMWAKTDSQQIFSGQWYYHSVPQGPQGDGVDGQVIATWSADHAALYVAIEHDAIEKIGMMMRMDLLEAPRQTSDLGGMSVKYAESGRGQSVTTDGRLLMQEHGWMIVRSKDDNLHALFSRGSEE